MKIAPFIATILIISSQSAHAMAEPFEGYIKLEGVKGEIVQADHRRWLRILGISELPKACSGEEEGGGLTVRVDRPAKYMPYLGSGNLEGGRARIDFTEPNGQVVNVILDGVFLSTSFGGAWPRPIVLGDAGDESSKMVTVNFTHVVWHRTDCKARTVASR